LSKRVYPFKAFYTLRFIPKRLSRRRYKKYSLKRSFLRSKFFSLPSGGFLRFNSSQLSDSLRSRFLFRPTFTGRIYRKYRRFYRRRRSIYQAQRFIRPFPHNPLFRQLRHIQRKLALPFRHYRFLGVLPRKSLFRFVTKRRQHYRNTLRLRLRIQRSFAKHFTKYVFSSAPFNRYQTGFSRGKFRSLAIHIFRLAFVAPKVFYLPIWPKSWRSSFNSFFKRFSSEKLRIWLWFNPSSSSQPPSPYFTKYFKWISKKKKVFFNRLRRLSRTGHTRKRRMGRFAKRSRRSRLRLKRRTLRQYRRMQIRKHIGAVRRYIYSIFFHPRDRLIKFRSYRYKRFRKVPVTKDQRKAWAKWVRSLMQLSSTNPRRFKRFDRWRFKALIRKRFFSRWPLLWSRRLLYFYIHQTSNNFFYYILSRGKLLAHYSNGRTEFFGSRRSSSVACESAIKHIAKFLRYYKLNRVFAIFSKRINFFTRTVLRILARNRIRIVGCRYRLTVSHGAIARKRATRRV